MDHFAYRDGTLHCEGLAARDLAQRFGTPLYVYSRATLEAHHDRLAAAFADLSPLICFSLKCCPNIHIARLLARRGAGADVVSGGELERAFLAGIPMDRVAFAGVGKSAEEIRAALDGRHSPLAGVPGMPDPGSRGPIAWFNAESPEEIDLIDRVARELGTTARVALRVNPDVDPRAHGSATPAATTTGKGGTKFGVDLADALPAIRRTLGMPGVRLQGLHLHLGSPIDTVEPYIAALHRVLALLDRARAEGIDISTINLGGGFGADYETDRAPHAADYAAAIVPVLRPRVAHGLRVVLEPGRTIAANAGLLLTRVVRTKTAGGKRFAICDAGMNTLVRPAMYGAFHFIWPAETHPRLTPHRRTRATPPVDDPDGLRPVEIVGPVCETGDVLGSARLIPEVHEGDLLAVFAAGAYGMSMASTYNARPLPAEVLVEGDDARLIRVRQRIADLVAHELEPGDRANR